MSARDERLAGNEALFREVNERVAEVATKFIEVEVQTEKVDFTCECGRADCSEPIAMTLVEYEAIRAESTHFGVVPEHQQPEIETVIRRLPTYFVVEKREQDAQRLRARQIRVASGPARCLRKQRNGNSPCTRLYLTEQSLSANWGLGYSARLRPHGSERGRLAQLGQR